MFVLINIISVYWQDLFYMFQTLRIIIHTDTVYDQLRNNDQQAAISHHMIYYN